MSWKEILKSDDDHKKDKRFIQRKKETWDEDGHEILMELYEAIKQGASLPKWAVVKDGKLDDRATKEKYINEATRDRTSNSYVYWSIRD